MQEGILSRLMKVVYWGEKLTRDNFDDIVADLLWNTMSFTEKKYYLRQIIDKGNETSIPVSPMLMAAKFYFGVDVTCEYSSLSEEQARTVTTIFKDFIRRSWATDQYLVHVKRIYEITKSSEILAEACFRAFYFQNNDIGFELLQQQQEELNLLHCMATLEIAADAKSKVFETLLNDPRQYEQSTIAKSMRDAGIFTSSHSRKSPFAAATEDNQDVEMVTSQTENSTTPEGVGRYTS